MHNFFASIIFLRFSCQIVEGFVVFELSNIFKVFRKLLFVNRTFKSMDIYLLISVYNAEFYYGYVTSVGMISQAILTPLFILRRNQN